MLPPPCARTPPQTYIFGQALLHTSPPSSPVALSLSPRSAGAVGTQRDCIANRTLNPKQQQQKPCLTYHSLTCWRAPLLERRRRSSCILWTRTRCDDTRLHPHPPCPLSSSRTPADVRIANSRISAYRWSRRGDLVAWRACLVVAREPLACSMFALSRPPCF